MTKKNNIEIISETYLQGLSLTEAVLELSFIPRKTIVNCYNFLTIEASKQQANESQFNLFQIRKIEKELFSLIDKNKLKPKAETNQQITELQNTYSKYLIN